MKKYLKMTIAICMCACMALLAAGCGSSSSPSSSSSQKASMSVSDKSASSSSAKNEVTNDPIYVLVIGCDTRYGTADGAGTKADDPSYSDTMMLVRVDPSGHRIGILSLPRDTEIQCDGQTMKLNEARYLHGIEPGSGALDQVKLLTGVNVDYYFETTFALFENLIDGMGGVTVDVPVTLSWSDIVQGEDSEDLVVEAGNGQTLDGPRALIFSRVRKLYANEGEAVRQMNARQVVKSGINFVASQPTADAAKYAKLLISMCSNTNMTEETLQAYIEKFMGQNIAFQTGSGPYVGGLVGDNWLIPREEDTYKRLIEAMETGGDMQAIVADPVAIAG